MEQNKTLVPFSFTVVRPLQFPTPNCPLQNWPIQSHAYGW